MIRPLSLFIGLRYIRAKRRNGFISFISFASTLGIALGVAILITVLSVMNGFDQQIRSHFFALTPQVTVSNQELEIQDFFSSLTQNISDIKSIQSAAPFVSGEGMVVKGTLLRSVIITGIVPENEATISKLPQQMIEGNLNELIPQSFKVIVSTSIAQQMNLKKGDSINVLTSQATTTPLGLFPRYREFIISGIYNNIGNNSLQEPIYIALGDAQKLLAAGIHTSGVHIKLADIYQAQHVSSQLEKKLPASFTVSNWTIESGAFFQALVLEKTMMFIILLLIITIASFNLVSMLIMVVHEKQADIAILRTLGASPGTIRNIFILQGSLLGLLGVVLGLVAGLTLSFNINPVTDTLQQIFHVQFIPGSVYGSGYLPVKILSKDVLTVCGIALGLSILATFYPALVAFRTEPAEALRYE